MESKYTNKYEVACAILDKLEQGGSSGGKFVLVDGTKLGFSTFSTIPDYYDFSEVTNFSYMFYQCSNLTSVPSLDTSKCTNFYGMFNNCQFLKSVPSLNTSNGTDFRSMFYYCRKLTSVPSLDVSNGTNFYGMFYQCESLTSVPTLNTVNATDLSSMFNYCYNLKNIQPLDASKNTNFYYMFNQCAELENVTFVGSINYSIDFKYSPKLTYNSIKSILTACAATTNTSSKTLNFNRTIADNNGELATLIGSCTDKGWTITGLTLQ